MSEEARLSHAWVAACDAGHLDMVEMMLPIVETTPLGINCKDGFGMTGLMAALEKGRLEVVDRLLDECEVDLDFTQQDFKGRNVLDMVLTSPSDYFLDYVLEELASTLVKKGELSKLLLPRLLSCVTHGKVNRFKKILEYYEVNFKDGALLSFLILSGDAIFISLTTPVAASSTSMHLWSTSSRSCCTVAKASGSQALLERGSAFGEARSFGPSPPS